MSGNGVAKIEAMAPTATQAQVLAIPPLTIRRLVLQIEGQSPLIVHRWSEKAKREMLDKQMGKAKEKKAPKDPQAEYESSLYRLPDGVYGFPSVAFKAAAVSASRQVGDLKMTFLRGSFHVPGELVPIEGDPRMREDMVRVGMGTADIRYRAEFPEWSARIPVRLNAASLTLEQLVHLFNYAGFSVGIGEWRPEKDGTYGMFTVTGVEMEGNE